MVAKKSKTDDEWDGTENDEATAKETPPENTADADAARREQTIGSAGPALTEAQIEGLDPIDVETHLDEASRRAELTNMQTEHETMSGLDAVSGTPNPGVTQEQSAAHTQPGNVGSDMSGRPPMASPMQSVEPSVLDEAKAAFDKAEQQDLANGKKGNEEATKRSAGWRSLRDLGVHKATMDALVAQGTVEVGSAPGMAHMPETGRLYRIKKDR